MSVNEDFIAEIATLLADYGREEEAFALTELASRNLEEGYLAAALHAYRGIRNA